MPKLNLTADEVLTTTRAVRKRLDFERPVDMALIRRCLEDALQAPTGSNSQGWQFIVVTDPEKISAIAGYYLEAFNEYEASPNQPTQQHLDDPSMADTQARVLSSARYLADNLHRTPALLIPCVAGLPMYTQLPLNVVSSIYGSILPAVWSFMLSAREQGLGTCWTTLHLQFSDEIGRLLAIPPEYAQVALIPIAHTLGTDFKPGPRKSLDDFLHVDSW